MSKFTKILGGIVLAVLFGPLLLSMAFFGAQGPQMLWLMAKGGFGWLVSAETPFGPDVDQAGLLSKGAVLNGCRYHAVALADGAQATPFAGSGDGLNWQPDPRADWLPTPLTPDEQAALDAEFARCKMSDSLTASAGAAVSGGGSWVLFAPDAPVAVYIYSAPNSMALFVQPGDHAQSTTGN